MNTTFAIFLNSLRTLNPVLVESVAAGYKLIYENGNDAEITDDVLFAEFLKQYPNSTREEFDSIRITAPGIFSSIRADLIKLATGTPIIGNDGSERAFPFAMDGTTPRRARPSLEAYEDYNPPHPDEPDTYASQFDSDGLDAESIKQFDADNGAIQEGDIVSYRNSDGFTVKGKVINIFTSTAGIECVSIDSFANSMPINKVRKV